MTGEEARTLRERQEFWEDLGRRSAELRGRIAERRAAAPPDTGRPVREEIAALAAEIGELRETLAAAYEAAGLAGEQEERPALRVIQGGAG